MLNFLLPILKNPITNLIVSKTIGAIEHKLEKDKIIRAREIEASKEVAVQQIVSSEKSWKDEWITIVYTLILIAHFVPYTQPFMYAGWELLKQANDLFWYSLLAIISGSFGINVLDKFKK